MFFVTINTLLLNMVFGIIIDAFTELRVETDEICNILIDIFLLIF